VLIALVLTGLFGHSMYVMNIKHDRDKALEAGFRLFLANSYNGVGVDEICKKTGMTKGAFYNAFKSKENFLLQALKTYSDAGVAHLCSELSPNKQDQAIIRLDKFYVKMLEDQEKSNYTGCMINNMMLEMGVTNKSIGRATATEFERLISVIEPVVKQAQLDGDFDPVLDSRLIAQLLHSTYFGVLTRTKGTHNYKESVVTMRLLLRTLKVSKG